MEWSKAAHHFSLFTMFYSNLMKNRSFLLPYIYGPLISLHILERNDKNINNRRVPMTGAVTWGKLNQVIMLLIFVRFNINQTAPPPFRLVSQLLYSESMWFVLQFWSNEYTLHVSIYLYYTSNEQRFWNYWSLPKMFSKSRSSDNILMSNFKIIVTFAMI